MEFQNNLGWFDYILVAATLLLTVFIGIHFGRKNKTNNDLLLGGQKISYWPVALSVMASYISAVTVLGYPAEVMGYGIEIFNLTIITFIVFPISVAIFVPFLYPMKLTSVFDYLERRFHCKTLRKIVSGIYIFEQVALAGVILYGPSLMLETFLGVSNWMSIFGIGILCTLYTGVGGIKAVVWTDALQAIIMMMGLLAILIKASISAGGVVNAFKIVEEGGRINLFKMNFDIFQRHNFFNFYIGVTFMMLFRSTVHQQTVQRFTCQPTLKDATKTMNLSVPVTLFVNVVIGLTGVALSAIYINCDPILLGKMNRIDHLVPYFVVTEMKTIPGILGLFTACIFSGVLSSISSTLNSLTAVTWEDFLSTIPVFASMDAKSQANISRLTGFAYGFLSILLAFSAQHMGSVFSASIQVAGACNGIVTAIFIAGFFIRYINATGSKVGAMVGITTMLTIGIRGLFSEALKEPLLPTNTNNCTISSVGNFTFTNPQPYQKLAVEWPDKIFTLSYLMYPLVGAIVTLAVATIVSFFSGGFQDQNFPEEYLHPLMRRKRMGNIDGTLRLTEFRS